MKDYLLVTKENHIVGSIRIMLGLIFIMTGLMKLLLSDYGNAWAIQLTEAKIPFFEFTYYFVPSLEVVLGVYLIIGLFTRISTFLIFPIMLVAIYVHLTVSNPGAFPSQPQEPYMPIMVIILSYIVFKNGGGSWSKDLLMYEKSKQKK